MKVEDHLPRNPSTNGIENLSSSPLKLSAAERLEIVQLRINEARSDSFSEPLTCFLREQGRKFRGVSRKPFDELRRDALISALAEKQLVVAIAIVESFRKKGSVMESILAASVNSPDNGVEILLNAEQLFRHTSHVTWRRKVQRLVDKLCKEDQVDAVFRLHSVRSVLEERRVPGERRAALCDEHTWKFPMADALLRPNSKIGSAAISSDIISNSVIDSVVFSGFNKGVEVNKSLCRFLLKLDHESYLFGANAILKTSLSLGDVESLDAICDALVPSDEVLKLVWTGHLERISHFRTGPGDPQSPKVYLFVSAFPDFSLSELGRATSKRVSESLMLRTARSIQDPESNLSDKLKGMGIETRDFESESFYEVAVQAAALAEVLQIDSDVDFIPNLIVESWEEVKAGRNTDRLKFAKEYYGVRDLVGQYVMTVTLPMAAIEEAASLGHDPVWTKDHDSISKKFEELHETAALELFSGKTVTEILDFSQVWHRPDMGMPARLRDLRGKLAWQPLTENKVSTLDVYSSMNPEPVEIEIHCLSSDYELVNEGRILRHCIGGGTYTNFGLAAESHYFSIRDGEKALATVQLETVPSIRFPSDSDLLFEQGQNFSIKQFQKFNNQGVGNDDLVRKAWLDFAKKVRVGEIVQTKEKLGQLPSEDDTPILTPLENFCGFTPIYNRIFECKNFFRSLRIRTESERKIRTGPYFVSSIRSESGWKNLL